MAEKDNKFFEHNPNNATTPEALIKAMEAGGGKPPKLLTPEEKAAREQFERDLAEVRKKMASGHENCSALNVACKRRNQERNRY